MRKAWQSAWREPAFRRSIWAAATGAVPLIIGLPVFFHHIGSKPGSYPYDPLVRSVGPIDVTWLSFTILYGGILITLWRAMSDPRLIARGLHAYAILQIMRMAAMQLVTFEPPVDIIPLIDPVTAVFYPGGVPFLKDLFFSGHTATLALMVCLAKGSVHRWAMIAATVAIGALVVVQHVHWTIDVLAAPLFVRSAWWASRLSLRVCGAGAA